MGTSSQGNVESTTALFAAAVCGDVESLASAITAGAHVDERDEYQQTALMLAAQEGNSEVVEALISLGANVNAQDDSGSSPLMFAALRAVWHGDEIAMHALLAAKADVNLRTHVGATVLSVVHRSTQNSAQKDRVIQLLKNAGAVRTY